MAKLTIRDIARLAGVSKSTVSLVLNGRPRVDPATRARVLQVMSEHNYVPSVAATALGKGGGSPFIGLIVPGLTWRLVASINFGIASVVERTAHEIILYTSTNDRDYRGVVDRILGANLVSGMLVVSHNQPMEPLVELYGTGLPVVLVNTLGVRADLPSVEADSYSGARSAVEHLLELGHRRIACVEGPPDYPCCVDRNKGYADALTQAGIAVDADLIRPGGFRPEEAHRHAIELLCRPDRPTAIFAHNDPTAYAVLDAVEECGLRVPEDVSVVGFDDIVSSAHVRPPLTTVRQPFEEMGRQAADMLLSALSYAPGPPRHVRMPTELVVRGSTGPAPRRRRRASGRPAVPHQARTGLEATDKAPAPDA
ncbi:LacI family DNA-binding transcriptional regulator [Streptomyces sp. TS71-3]|uniref:LacI family DNA-binding transcriptional regulator n=1 Tax=Streptomyces sp. TS71-3 TaxID=2733862 RepID=UPI001AFD0144|nr:LacI family DNA-binding transcriptional regulator [Streptomyces sp. TS71-3]GHJ41693.1 LacI family transcriptional regulator [Streptomyces sp. TS71-3]